MTEPLGHIARMAPYALANKGDPGSVSLSENECAYSPSEKIIAAATSAARSSHFYSDPDWTDLRKAIAKNLHLRPNGILCGAGSMELIGALIHAFCGSADTVIGSEHGYLFVATACAQIDTCYIQVPEVNLHISVDAILDHVTSATKVVFICNPANPTGTSIANAEICRLSAALPEDVLLVVDQAYAEFDAQDQQPMFELVEAGKAVITRTFSKAYGLAGARVGWGYFPPDVAKEVRKLLNPNNISGVSQAMATAAICDQAWMEKVVRKTAARREKFCDILRDAGYKIPQSHTNFVLIEFSSVEEAQKADRQLRSEGLILRPMAAYGLPNSLRATIGAQPAMDRVAKTLIELRRAEQ